MFETQKPASIYYQFIIGLSANLGYTWMYDGVTNFMRNTENVFISKDGTLYYSSINKTDEKRLACNIVSPSIQSGQYGPFFNLKVESANGIIKRSRTVYESLQNAIVVDVQEMVGSLSNRCSLLNFQKYFQHNWKFTSQLSLSVLHTDGNFVEKQVFINEI